VGWEKVACLSTKVAISLKRVKIEETLLWRAYRKSSTLFRFFGSPPYFYFRFRLYGHRDGRFCLIFARTAQQSVLDGTNGIFSFKLCAYWIMHRANIFAIALLSCLFGKLLRPEAFVYSKCILKAFGEGRVYISALIDPLAGIRPIHLMLCKLQNPSV